MTTTMKSTLIFATAAFALAGTAQAGDMNYKSKAKMMDSQQTTAQMATQTTTVQSTETVSVRQLDGAVITSTPADANYAVLGRIERNGQAMYRVAGDNGMEFLNFVPSEIVPVTTDVDELDTVTFEHNGVTYINRIVRDDADSVG